MKELSDNEFDKLLKQKSEAHTFDFDEDAWDLMEGKLRKRDRAVFFRKASAAFLLLLVGGGFLLWNLNLNEEQVKVSKSKVKPIGKVEMLKPAEHVTTETNLKSQVSVSKSGPVRKLYDKASVEKQSSILVDVEKTPEILFYVDIPRLASLAYSQTMAADTQLITLPEDVMLYSKVEAPLDSSSLPDKAVKDPKSRNLTLGFSLSAGPEYSSINTSGGKATMNFGLLVNTTIKQKLTISSGLRYGLKNYQASTTDYQLKNPARAVYISGIDASCNILEIPVLLSYMISDNASHKIKIHTGLSSYLMLKEEYNFSYTPQSGYKDYLLVKKNANNHSFSVLNLSASFEVKSKLPHLGLAIEPYVKLPLGGVGEGNVRLKSGGLAVNMNYTLPNRNQKKYRK
jgi:hypothetical protein